MNNCRACADDVTPAFSPTSGVPPEEQLREASGRRGWPYEGGGVRADPLPPEDASISNRQILDYSAALQAPPPVLPLPQR